MAFHAIVRSSRVLACSLVFIVGAGACGGGDDTGGTGGTGGVGGSGGMAGMETGGAGGTAGTPTASCPTLAPSWVIEKHCLAGFVTEVIPFEQTDCDVRLTGAFSVLAGSVDDDGNIMVDGALGVMDYACEGTFDETEMLVTCTEDCPVRLIPE